MRRVGDIFELSATDLSGYLNCRHLTALDRALAEGNAAKPEVFNDPLADLLRQRGKIHEASYVQHLTASGFKSVTIDGVEVSERAVAETLAAMTAGAPIIVQGALSSGGWIGRADILRKVQIPSEMGDWSYEPVDTKLARKTRAGSVLQLCLYAELLAGMQGIAPEYMHVIVPWSDFEPESYKYTDYAAYFRQAKRAMLATLSANDLARSYPEPVEHCEVCRWRVSCDKRRRDDDHLSLVAGISKMQTNELAQHGIKTVEALAVLPLPLPWKPDRGSTASLVRVREQARIQVEARRAGAGKFEILPVQIGFGLTRLPDPCVGDIFLDLEGDPFAGEGGSEYLFGYATSSEDGALEYSGAWAFSRDAEKKAFEDFIDFVLARWRQWPDLHIYHYAPYEPSALKRLMGRYATREEELDRILRARLFVDLFQVVRHGVRASVESYSIKKLEPFFGFVRAKGLKDANVALAQLQAGLELGDAPSISNETKAAVLAYNKDDCFAVAHLRAWLEDLRSQIVAGGGQVSRPLPGDGGMPSDKVAAWLLKINPLIEQLTADVPANPAERTPEQHGRWLLGNILDWHRREEKAIWWDYFRLADLSTEDLLDERAGLAGLKFVGPAGGTAKAPIHRYSFPPQETELRGGEDLRSTGGAKFGKVEAISLEDNRIDIKKRQDTAGFHAEAVFSHKIVDTKDIAEALVRIAEHVLANGLTGEGPYRPARDLLLRNAPRVGSQPLRGNGETALVSALRLCGHLAGGILPIQGPPGSGKTFTGAQMICELVRQGKKVGVTANSHKVIRHLIDETIREASKKGCQLDCYIKADEIEPAQHCLSFAKSSADLIAALDHGVSVGGGTAWLWARPDASELVDVLFVDEAAQMALARALAVSQAAKTMVLIGDPQQLDQPMQGSHPEGTDVSALDHVLGGQHTIGPEKGLFLEETYRLHPAICAYISELFYDGKLRSQNGLEQQKVNAPGILKGSGLRYIPVKHGGNQNSSPEEALAIKELVDRILGDGATWVDGNGAEKPVLLADILIMAPYNAQVFEIQRLLPGALVGTVDKFQGQQGAVAIYSTATSSHADAPRGMEFLYSLNRLNVAASRAKCLMILVSSPLIFEAECRTPRQMQLANAFCRYIEMAEVIRV